MFKCITHSWGLITSTIKFKFKCCMNVSTGSLTPHPVNNSMTLTTFHHLLWVRSSFKTTMSPVLMHPSLLWFCLLTPPLLCSRSPSRYSLLHCHAKPELKFCSLGKWPIEAGNFKLAFTWGINNLAAIYHMWLSEQKPA